MDAGRILRIIVVIAIAYVAWKYVLPWVKQQGDRGAETTAASAGDSCVQSAENAAETWGSGLRQFVNPPYDLNAWSSFRGNVESEINAADADCDCAAESCGKARAAMRDLRSLVSDLDSTIRSGSDASDFVQRQERIDNALSEAAELARDGK